MMVVLVALENQILLTASGTWEVCHHGSLAPPRVLTEEEFLIRSNINKTERFKVGSLGFVRTVGLML